MGLNSGLLKLCSHFYKQKKTNENKKFAKLCSRITNVTAESFYFTQFTKQNVRAGLYPRVAVDSRMETATGMDSSYLKSATENPVFSRIDMKGHQYRGA